MQCYNQIRLDTLSLTLPITWLKYLKLPRYEIENEEEEDTDSELECLEYDELDYLSEGEIECVRSSESEFSTYLDGLPAVHHGCFAHVLATTGSERWIQTCSPD